jgi:hypothetical protein
MKCMGGCAFFVVVSQGAGKSAVLNSLIGHPVLVRRRRRPQILLIFHIKCIQTHSNAWNCSSCNLFLCQACRSDTAWGMLIFGWLVCCHSQPTGENGATRAPILIQMQQRSSSSNSSSSSGNRGGLYIVLDGQATNVSASKSSDLPSC